MGAEPTSGKKGTAGTAPHGRDPAGSALRIHAVVRGGWGRGLPAGWRLVEAGPIAAAVRPESGEAGGFREHARQVQALIREVPLVPAPPGLLARDERAVRGFLERARLPLVEALDLCEGGWALRVHLARSEDPTGTDHEMPEGGGATVDDPAGAAEGLYRMLRRRARAARRLPPGAGILSAAFLVARPRWIPFVEEVTRREGALPGLEADVTGPWAPWDFVRAFTEEEP